jgi:hypothetical protein
MLHKLGILGEKLPDQHFVEIGQFIVSQQLSYLSAIKWALHFHPSRYPRHAFR